MAEDQDGSILREILRPRIMDLWDEIWPHPNGRKYKVLPICSHQFSVWCQFLTGHQFQLLLLHTISPTRQVHSVMLLRY